MTLTARSTLAVVARSVGQALHRAGIRAVLTGGACASMYSGGRYHSVDIDFVLSGRVTQDRLDRVMSSAGFTRRGDRYVHPTTRYFVEFPRGPLAIGEDFHVAPIEWRTPRGRMLSLSPTDACRDRLAAFYHWNDRQSLRVAAMIASRNEVDMRLVRRWTAAEGAAERFPEFISELERVRRRPERSGRSRPRSPKRPPRSRR